MLWLHIAAAYAVNGPYHGASAAIHIWKVQVEPNEFSKNYLLIASPQDRQFKYIRGKDPPDIKNQIAVGMAVSAHLESIFPTNDKVVVNFIWNKTHFDKSQYCRCILQF